MDSTGDGVVAGEDANSDGETAVDVDKEDAQQQKENVETVVNVAWIYFQSGNLRDCQASCQDAEAIEDTVEHFPDVLKGHVRLTVQGGIAEEHDDVGKGGRHDEDACHKTNA